MSCMQSSQVKSSSGATRPRSDHPGPASCSSPEVGRNVENSTVPYLLGTLPGYYCTDILIPYRHPCGFARKFYKVVLVRRSSVPYELLLLDIPHPYDHPCFKNTVSQVSIPLSSYIVYLWRNLDRSRLEVRTLR